MKKIILVLVIAALGSGFVCSTEARQGHGDRSFRHHAELGICTPLIQGPWHRVEIIAEKINLDEEQLQKIKELRHTFRHTIEPMKAQLRLSKGDLKELIAGEDASTKKESLGLIDLSP